jgi:hypothetical protein
MKYDVMHESRSMDLRLRATPFVSRDEGLEPFRWYHLGATTSGIALGRVFGEPQDEEVVCTCLHDGAGVPSIRVT